MRPDIWGKYGWTYLHFVALGYPDYPTEKDKQNYFAFINYFGETLPCGGCRENLKEHLQILPLNSSDLESKTTLFKWTIDLHNVVNVATGKKALSYDEALDDINRIINLTREKIEPQNIHYISYVLGFIVIALLIYIIYSNRRKKLIV